MAIKIRLSAKRNHLVFSDVQFKDGIQDGEGKLGVLEIENPVKADETLAKANKMKWELGEPDESGFAPVFRVK